jgi:hypothetical protein
MSSTNPTTYSLYIHFNIVFHLSLRLPSILFPSGFQTEILYTFLISPMSCPSHPPWLDHRKNIYVFYGEYNLWNSLMCNFFQPPLLLSLLGPNVLLTILFLNALNCIYWNILHVCMCICWWRLCMSYHFYIPNTVHSRTCVNPSHELFNWRNKTDKTSTGKEEVDQNCSL